MCGYFWPLHGYWPLNPQSVISGTTNLRGNGMRILIVEDEKKTADYLQKGLEEHGFTVDVASNGEDGLHLARSEAYDLIVLDVMLPVRSGWSIIKELRNEGIEIPVIFLSARDTVHDRVHGLELGADDYLVKPFAFSELLARIRIILRRQPLQQQEVMRVHDLELDLIRHKTRRAGIPLDLTAKEFQLLSLLLRRKGEVLTRTAISEQVWGINFDSDTNIVDVAIRRLRKKVDDPFQPKLIHTIRGVGYVLDENI
jgi:two-component system, OmpR family, copper resistance phosphate regulon response regulator CusR